MSILMKDSGVDWIGDIPEHWEIKRIKDISVVSTGQTPPRDKLECFSDEKYNNYLWIKPENLNSFEEISETTEYITKYGLNFIKIYNKESLILSGIGAGLGNIGISKYNFTTNQQNHILSKHKNYKYLFYFMFAAKEYVKSLSVGNILSILNATKLKNSFVINPPQKEQSKIVSYLDTETSKIDRKILILEQKYEKLEEYKQSVIFETVTKGLDASVAMKNSGIDWIGDIPAHWEVLRLKSIYNYKNGYAFSDTDYSKEPNGNYLIKITNVTENGIQENETFCIEVNSLTKKFKIKEDSVLYALSGATAGKCCFLDKTDKNFYLNQRVAQMQLKNGINKYFYYLVCNKVFANLLLNLYPQTAQPNIGKNDLDNSFVPFVFGRKEQEEIVTFLDSLTSKIENKKEIIKKQIELLKEYKQTIIYEAVTGKMEIL